MNGRSKAARVVETSPAEVRAPARAVRRIPEIEVAIASRVRAARLHAGLSQTALGAVVGVSFQQMQKYEKGKDRIAAGTLVRMAEALGVPPSQFLEDDAAPTGPVWEARRVVRLAGALVRVADVPVRDALTGLAEAMADGAVRTSKVDALLSDLDAAVRAAMARDATPRQPSRRTRATRAAAGPDAA